MNMSPPIVELATAQQRKYRKSELFLLQLIVHPAEFLSSPCQEKPTKSKYF
jgi:hypothetical protein